MDQRVKEWINYYFYAVIFFILYLIVLLLNETVRLGIKTVYTNLVVITVLRGRCMKNNNDELISVIIPTYNRGYIIKKSIESVLAQTYTNFELIIVDDGSTDNTKQVIDEFKDYRIRYIFQNNAGACAARNKGISVSKGKYIAFHDSDDEWFPDKLKIQLSALKKTGAEIVVSQMLLKNAEYGETVIPQLTVSQFLYLHTMPPGIGTQTLLMKKEVAEAVRFDPIMPRFQDMEWLIRAVKNYKTFFIKQPLVDYEIQEDSISSSHEKLYKASSIIIQKYPDIMVSAPIIAEDLSNGLIAAGMAMYENNNKDYTKYLLLGFSFSKKYKSKVKYFLVKLHLFKLYYKYWKLKRKA